MLNGVAHRYASHGLMKYSMTPIKRMLPHQIITPLLISHQAFISNTSFRYAYIKGSKSTLSDCIPYFIVFDDKFFIISRFLRLEPCVFTGYWSAPAYNKVLTLSFRTLHFYRVFVQYKPQRIKIVIIGRVQSMLNTLLLIKEQTNYQ